MKLHLFLAVAGLFLAVGSQAQTNAPTPSGKLEVKDEKGDVLDLTSREALRAEFRYLKRKWHEVDLKGPAVETDGWTYNIPEAEWPFMGVCYFGYACANLAKHDPPMREEALAEMRWLIEAVQTPRLTGFIVNHFGEPFIAKEIMPSTFVHGHFLNLAVRYREVSGDTRYDTVIHRVATALANGFQKSDQAILRSYKDMWWISDNCPVLSALHRYGALFKRDATKVTGRFVQSVKAHYLDKQTGLIATYVDADAKRINQGPRGISVMYALHFLRDFDPAFAEDQYARAKQHFVRSVLGLAAVREFPEGSKEKGDVDSGPVLLGLGPSASGFGLAAAAVMGDAMLARQLFASSCYAGMPVLRNGELHYATMPTVGQTVILFGKTQLLGVTNATPAP